MNFVINRRRFVRTLMIALLLLSALVLGGCVSEGGLYQGGGDSSPSWRS